MKHPSVTGIFGSQDEGRIVRQEEAGGGGGLRRPSNAPKRYHRSYLSLAYPA